MERRLSVMHPDGPQDHCHDDDTNKATSDLRYRRRCLYHHRSFCSFIEKMCALWVCVTKLDAKDNEPLIIAAFLQIVRPRMCVDTKTSKRRCDAMSRRAPVTVANE